MHAAHVNRFSFPEVTLRILSDHYTVALRNIAVRLWQEEKYKKAGKKNYYTASIHVPRSHKAKHCLVTFHFHVAAAALVVLDNVTMQFLRGKGDSSQKDDAQLNVVMRDNTLEEVIFFYPTHVTGMNSHTYSSHFEHHEMDAFFAYIEAEHRKEKKNLYHWIHLFTIPGKEKVTLVSAPAITSTKQIKNSFLFIKEEQVFRNTKKEDESIATEDYLDALQSLLGMLPLQSLS